MREASRSHGFDKVAVKERKRETDGNIYDDEDIPGRLKSSVCRQET